MNLQIPTGSFNVCIYLLANDIFSLYGKIKSISLDATIFDIKPQEKRVSIKDIKNM